MRRHGAENDGERGEKREQRERDGGHEGKDHLSMFEVDSGNEHRCVVGVVLSIQYATASEVRETLSAPCLHCAFGDLSRRMGSRERERGGHGEIIQLWTNLQRGRVTCVAPR